MKRIIRKNTFETNSSSSHSFSICIKDKKISHPKEINFEAHEFHNYPFDGDDMSSMQGRANYLYSIAIQCFMENKLKEALQKALPNTKLKFEHEYREIKNTYLINHQAQYAGSDLLDRVLEDSVLLINYLLDDKTDVLITGDYDYSGVTGGNDRFVIGDVKYE
ncbi:hypothetical protein CWE04_11440 [Thomasclavelia cocleata]|uniref:Uncharacterized protein n=1 Tax=Thomasclavelia cocleata TaxID=69824 RepID=A0A1I0GD21_9FIRM|nr:hypothetical protein [Thomasclavelia cocleata]MCR1959859.1 hypothetical protein [Thomasclavelia cocleata]NDO43209.1 hypothetical protein [Thomasclavelia cocleata]PJN79819.1 hypothetical protein CWE04_11440 [Thomasclavelia cocleata]SET68811.1 hypothetical protein SAMN04489758_12835 [Thomasclavelia cocleata]